MDSILDKRVLKLSSEYCIYSINRGESYDLIFAFGRLGSNVESGHHTPFSIIYLLNRYYDNLQELIVDKNIQYEKIETFELILNTVKQLKPKISTKDIEGFIDIQRLKKKQ